MAVTLADYSWWGQWRPAWAEAYCVTLVGDSTAEGVLDELGATAVARVRGFDAFYDRAVADYDPSRAVIGVIGLDRGWTLVAEVNGFAGVTQRLIGPMSGGRTIVSHFRNINAVYQFNWWADHRLLVELDLLFPAERFGADPDAVVDDISAIGVPLAAEPDEIAAIDCGAAGFALAERITGVSYTSELFEGSDFLIGVLEMPGGQEQQRYEEALRATWRNPSTW